MTVQVDGELLATRDYERSLALVRAIALGQGYSVAIVCRVNLLLQERPAALYGSLAVRVRYDLERRVGRVEERVRQLAGVVVLEARGERSEAAEIQLHAHADV